MKIYMMTDLEGVSGIVDFDRQCWESSPDYRQAQQLLTAEVNAAVQGAVEAGVDTVVVNDGHHSGQNILAEQLHPAAELIQGPMRLNWLPWLDERCAALALMGFHAMAGTPRALMCHSMELNMVSITLNGEPIGELGLAAAIAGSYGVPAILVTGDQAAVDELRRLVPQIEGVAVKQSLTRGLTRQIAPVRARELICQGMARAVQRIREIPPYRVPKPYTIQVTFVEPIAESLLRKTSREARLISPTTIEYRGDDLNELAYPA